MNSIILGEEFRDVMRVVCNTMDTEYRLKCEAILAFYQDAIASYLSGRHLAAFDLKKKGKVWIITECSYRLKGALPVWRDEVGVTVSPTEASALKMYFDFALTDTEGNVFAEGSSCWGVIDLETGRPTELESLMTIEGTNTASHGREPLAAVKEAAGTLVHKVCPNDLDFNYHVNNIGYVADALAARPLNTLRGTVIEGIRVKYLRQVFPGESLRFLYDTALPDAGRMLCTVENGDSPAREVCRMEIDFRKDTPADMAIRCRRSPEKP